MSNLCVSCLRDRASGTRSVLALSHTRIGPSTTGRSGLFCWRWAA